MHLLFFFKYVSIQCIQVESVLMFLLYFYIVDIIYQFLPYCIYSSNLVLMCLILLGRLFLIIPNYYKCVFFSFISFLILSKILTLPILDQTYGLSRRFYHKSRHSLFIICDVIIDYFTVGQLGLLVLLKGLILVFSATWQT